MTVGATVVTVCAGIGFCVGEGATVAVAVGDAVAGLLTTGALEGTVTDWVAVAVAVAVAVDDTVVGTEVATDVEAADVDVTVELLGAVDDAELAVSAGDVALVAADVPVVSDGDVDALVEVEDVDGVASDDEVVVEVVDVELDDAVSTTGTGNKVSGEDGRTGCGSPGGGSVAAGFCSTTL